MPDAPITASNLLSAGWERSGGAAGCFVLRFAPLLEARVTHVFGETITGWRLTVLRGGIKDGGGRLVYGMRELGRFVDEGCR